MLVNTNPLFYVPFCHIQTNDWEHKKEQLLKILNEDNLLNIGSNGESDTIRSDFGYQANNPSKAGMHNRKLAKIFEQEIKEFRQALNISPCKIRNSWFERGVQSEYHTIHNHGSVGYSVVCYLEYDEKVHTPTIFYCPFLNFINGDMNVTIPKEVVEGDIIFFPSAIAHSTQPSYSDIPRTIVSFNLDI
tara:strand:+ start:66 stop:632 length:567 start_codon:yes stop_codon:yes gene_type:complete